MTDFALAALILGHPLERHATSDSIIDSLRFRMSSSTEGVWIFVDVPWPIGKTELPAWI